MGGRAITIIHYSKGETYATDPPWYECAPARACLSMHMYSEVLPYRCGSKVSNACTIKIMAPAERLGMGRAADEKLKIYK